MLLTNVTSVNFIKYKTTVMVLAGHLSQLKRHPMHKKAAGSIPDQGTNLGCGFNTYWGRIQDALDRCFSLTLMFVSLSRSKVNENHTLARI